MTTKKQQTSTRGETGDKAPVKRRQDDRKGVRPEVTLPPTLTVKHLGELMDVNPIDVIKQLMRNGVMAAINQAIAFDLAAAVTPAFGYTAKRDERVPAGRTGAQVEEEVGDEGNLRERNPVVTILGHVDHGKTTLLDTMRNSRIASKEFGGITQSIGAYQMDYKGRKITFLDTPGHEAFTEIRARGAKVTDIAILVVAADDGVMPQTVEAINHARAADLPIVVAINKMDRPDANPDTVKRQLTDHGLLLEEWGGDTIAVPISATNNTGIEDLLESILAVAEVAGLKADFDRLATGTIIEAKLDRNKGPLATVLVQNGLLGVGNIMVAGTATGRVKAMVDDRGVRVNAVGPSQPVELLGFSELPQAGDRFSVATDDKLARAIVAENAQKRDEEKSLARALTLDQVMTSITTGKSKEFNLILKADVQGSVEAVRSSLERLDGTIAKINILHAGSGGVNESDVLLASASSAIIVAFNASVEPGAQRAAEQEKVQIRTYNIIYHLIGDIEKAIMGTLEPTYRDIVVGQAEVRAVFTSGKTRRIAGSIVTNGRLTRDLAIRVMRDGAIVHEGSISSLRRFKDDVNEVASGFECGIEVSGYNGIQEGDILEAHRRERV